MSSFQKTIKYIAIAFAILLAVGIISGIANAAFAVVSAVVGGIGYSEKEAEKGKTDVTDTFTDVKSLDINNSTGKLMIKIGDTFKVEAKDVSKNFKAEVQSDGTLKISENEKGIHFFWFDFDGFDNPNSKITLYLPEDFVAEEVNIDTGAGNVTIDRLQTDRLIISAGAGNITAQNLGASDFDLDGGVGNVTLDNVKITDADFECGVGNLSVEGILLGDTRIDCGVGNVNLDLAGNSNEYDLDVDSGVGTIRLNGEKISDNYKIDQNRENSIRIDGGVGDVRINMKQEF